MNWIRSLFNVDGKSGRMEFSVMFVLLLIILSIIFLFIFSFNFNISFVMFAIFSIFKVFYLISFILGFLYGRVLFRRLNDIGTDRVYGLLITGLLSVSFCILFVQADFCKILSSVFMILFIICNIFLMFIKEKDNKKEKIESQKYDRFVLNRLKYIILTVIGNLVLPCVYLIYDDFPAFVMYIFLGIVVIYNIIVAGMRMRDLGYNFFWSILAILPITNLFAFMLLALGKSAERIKLPEPIEE